MTNFDLMDLVSYIRSRVKNASDIRKSSTLALGVAIGKTLAVSNTAMVNAVTYFDETLLGGVTQKVCEFNEGILVDVDEAIETARAIWFIRQFTVSPDTSSFVSPKGEQAFAEKFFGVPVYMKPETSAYLNKHSEVMITIINRITALLSQPQAA